MKRQEAAAIWKQRKAKTGVEEKVSLQELKERVREMVEPETRHETCGEDIH